MRMRDRLNSVVRHPGYNEPTTIALALGGILSVTSAVQQSNAAKKAEKLEKEKSKGAERQGQVEAERARRAAIRDKMIAQGQVQAQGANQGFGGVGTSGISGAIGSIGSQTASNIGTINRRQGEAVAMAGIQSDIYSAQNQGAQWGQIGSLGMNIMNNSQQIGSIFKA